MLDQQSKSSDALTTFNVHAKEQGGYAMKLHTRHDDPSLHGLPLPEGPFRTAFGKLRIGEVTILGGYEGHGKSAVASQLALHIAPMMAEHNAAVDRGEAAGPKQGVLYCTMEMDCYVVMARALTQTQGVAYASQLTPELLTEDDFVRIQKALDKCGDWPVTIADSAIIKTPYIRDWIEVASVEYTPRLVVVDYLQLLADNTGDNDVSRLDNIVRDLKEMARNYKCHVLALSSLNRAVEGVMPTASNLRSSGGIAYAADNVVILHQPKMYDPSVDDQWHHVAILSVYKQRNGPVGEHYLKWHPDSLTFGPLDSSLRERLPALTKKRWGSR